MAFSPSRRELLRGLGLALGGLALAGPADAAPPTTARFGAMPPHALADWVRRENARPGDGGWLRGVPAPAGDLEGYADATSVNLGGIVSFFVSTPSPTYAISVYRMGYYQGLGARLVETRTGLRGVSHPIPPPDQYGTVDCHWPIAFRLRVDHRYPPGQYLVRLENVGHQFRFIPFMVRDDSSRAAFVYLSAVTTWQAYNTWGGLQSLPPDLAGRRRTGQRCQPGRAGLLQPALRSRIRQRGRRLRR